MIAGFVIKPEVKYLSSFDRRGFLMLSIEDTHIFVDYFKCRRGMTYDEKKEKSCCSIFF